jgi:hypothetical protein
LNQNFEIDVWEEIKRKLPKLDGAKEDMKGESSFGSSYSPSVHGTELKDRFFLGGMKMTTSW